MKVILRQTKNVMKIYYSLFTSLLFSSIFGQIGINNSDPKATLDIAATPNDTSKFDGVIAPRLTGSQLRAKTYTTDQNAAIVFVTTADTSPQGQTSNVTAIGYYYFDGTANKWIPMTNFWGLEGNAGTTPLSNTTGNGNFIGTTDGANLKFKAGNSFQGSPSGLLAGSLEGGENGNTGFGVENGAANSNGGTNNTGIGRQALGNINFQLTGSFNTGIGDTALDKIQTGSYNTGIGYVAGGDHNGGDNNTFVGAMPISTSIGSGILNGNYNTTLGAMVEPAEIKGSYQLNIGNVIFGNNINDSSVLPNKLYLLNTPYDYGTDRAKLKNDRIGIANVLPNSTLQVGGSVALPIVATGNITLGDNDYTVLATGNITLPSASGVTGRIYNIVYKSGSPTVIGSMILSGAAISSYGLNTNDGGRGITVQSDGTDWYVTARF